MGSKSAVGRMSSPQGEQLMVELHAMGTNWEYVEPAGRWRGMRSGGCQWSHAANMSGKCPGKQKVVKVGPIAV